jgi:hypothetical protein
MGLGDTSRSVKNTAGVLLKKTGGIFARKKVRIALAVFVVLLVLAPLVTVFVVKVTMRGEKPPVDIFVPDRIADEDIFFPNEPDFLAPLIFEREQKETWTEEDAEAFWTDPLEYGSAYWRERISDTVDGLLERVP